MNYHDKYTIAMSKLKPILLVFLLLLCSQTASFAQTVEVSGVVTDSRGAPLAGVLVAIEGTTIGVITGNGGAYSLKVAPSGKLGFSLLGFLPQTFSVGNNAVINIQLQPSYNDLDDVVVIGYGTQIRRNVVGAVETISGDVLSDRPNAYMLRSLQGQVPGLNITMVDGKPSRSATINIRGNTQSIGAGGSALTLIDGVEGDLTAMNPEDVESVSILKDASSTAVYGARGAFGVILVTTKRAKAGKVSVNYSGNFSVYTPTVRPEYETDGMAWYDNFMTSYKSSKHALPGGINNFFKWSQDWEDEYKKRHNDPNNSYLDWRINSGGQYEYFGNTDWYNEFYKKSNMGHQHNLTVTGGGDIASYSVSARYYTQDGIYRPGNERFNQTNVRAKGSVKVFKWLTLENNTDFVFRNYHQPMGYYNLSVPRLIEHQGFPVTKMRNPDGSWTAAAVTTGYAGMHDQTTYRDNAKYDMTNTTLLTGSFLDNTLIAKADFSVLYNHSTRNDVTNMDYYNTAPDISAAYPTDSWMDKRDFENRYYTGNVSLSYSPIIGKDHSLNALVGLNIENKEYRAIQMKRDGFLNPNKPNLSLMDGTDITLQDTGSYDWSFMGIFYRVSYAYKGRYLLEASGRYDGSSKFPSSQQWGFFPSVSAGWRISDESFMQDTKGWLTNLKLRLSAGMAGNGNVAPYLYTPFMTISKSGSVLTGGIKDSYTSAPNIIPSGLTWETVTTYDAGLDADFFNGRLNFTADIYEKQTTDMYVIGAEIPAVAGYAAPKGNNADMRTRGFEVSVAWQDGFMVAKKRFNYNVRLSLWDSRSKITKYTAKNNILPTLYSNSYYEGMELGEIWGYTVDGLFESDAEAQAWGISAQSGTFWSGDAQSWGAGDIKFADLDNNNVINNGNNTLENHGDLKKIGNTAPRYHYGINLGLNWNNIGISMFFQGVMQRDWYPAGESGFFWGQYNRPYSYSLPWQNSDRWTESNPDVNAYWPRMRGYLSYTGRGTLRAANDKYLQNAGYCRLKNITVDYVLPSKWLKKVAIERLRVYVSAENLFFWSPLKKYAKNFDPEQITAGDADFSSVTGTDGQGYGYPQTKSFSVGLNITF